MNQQPAEPLPEPASSPEPTAGRGDYWTEEWANEWPDRPEPADPELYDLGPDPVSGSPDCGAWLTDLTPADLEAMYTNPPDALSKGAEQPVGAGFGSGGWLDQLIPGPVLSSFSQDTVDSGLGSLEDDELVGVLRAARRLASWQAAVELRAVGELDARRRRESGRPGWSRVSEYISCELAAALTLTGRSADLLLCLSRDLARLPMVLRALADGRIDRARAEIFAQELAGLSDVAAAAIAEALCDVAGSMTTSQLRYALRRMVLATDPTALRRRAAKAKADARVETWQETSGNAALAGRELPSADAIAADRRIAAIARSLKDAGAVGTMDQLRAAVFVALLTGRDPESVRSVSAEEASPAGRGPGTGSHTQQEPAAKTQREPAAGKGPQPSAEPASQTGPQPGEGPTQSEHSIGGLGSGWTGPWLGGSVNLTMPLTAWLGDSDAPGDVPGLGALDAGTCRDLAERIRRNPSSRWCVTLTGRDGRAVAHACGSTGPGPPRPARPKGAGPSGADPPCNERAWLGRLTFHRIECGVCGHEHKIPGYRPSSLLRTLVKVRHRTCAFPGCRRPAVACDDDHTIPYDQGGPTCACNLAPLCRLHHQAKQAPGWGLSQPEPGLLVWTTPHGRTYATRPDPYPT
ncbi:MAG: hypothetical protein ACTHJW_12445 [Streptosporangiaceae bacterium]